MNLFQLLKAKSKLFYLFTILLGFVSSLTNLGLLLLINNAIAGSPAVYFGRYNYLAFIGLIALSFVSSAFFQNYMVSITNGILYDLELSIVQRIRQTTFQCFERLGVEKLYAAVSDARILSRVPEIFVSVINSLVTILCTLCYLFWISPLGGVAILGLMGALFAIYQFRNVRLERNLNKVRDLQNGYYKSLNELLHGFKQVRMSFSRSNNLYNKHILVNRDNAKELSTKTSKDYVINELIGVYSWYIVLGFVIFLLPVLFDFKIAQIAAFITAVLFMMSPVSQLIMFFPFQTSFKIALQRINRIYDELEVQPAVAQPAMLPDTKFSSIRFENVTYEYDELGIQQFTLQPVNLTINAGDILFIVGPNGSGKSTFIKLLTGLYMPVGGKIFIDEQEVDWQQYAAFCNNMTAVLTDYHLFKENYDEFDLQSADSKYPLYKKHFNLDGILEVNRDRNWVNINVSKGQQKRLALLLGMLEDKPLLILDEWAAEQDPLNRKLFYTRWLEDMRKMGKTIIAVSHDDDYYHTADRVIRFDYGKIVSDAIHTSPTSPLIIE